MSPKRDHASNPEDTHMAALQAADENNKAILLEHFGFPAIAFVDDVINTVNDSLYIATTEIATMVEAKIGKGEEAHQGAHMFETLMEASVDKAFDVFELYTLQHTLAIQPGIAIELPHYENLDLTISPEDEEALDEEILDLRRKLTMKRAFLGKIQAMSNSVDAEVEKMSRVCDATGFLDADVQGQSILTLPESLQFISDGLGRLGTLSEVTREAYTSCAHAGPLPISARAAYIDTAVRTQVALSRRLDERERGGKRRRSSMGAADREFRAAQATATSESLSAVLHTLKGEKP